jgi:hypothetical protein
MTKQKAPRKPGRPFTWSIRTEKLPAPAADASRFALEGCDGCGCGGGCEVSAAAPPPVRKRGDRAAR